MKYGILTTNFGDFGKVDTLMTIGQAADNARWDGFFLWDHIQFPQFEPTTDPWMALALIASKTENISLGTLVTPVPRRRIVKLAREVLTLDQISNGRAILGVGLGFPVLPEYQDFGDETDLRVRAEALDEGLEVLRNLFAGNSIEFLGKHYQVKTEGFCPTTNNRHIAIWVAGAWPGGRPFQRAAKWDGVVPMAADAMEGGEISVAEYRNLVAYINTHRESNDAFEFTKFGNTATADDVETVKAYRAAGATWWIEVSMPGANVEDLLARIEQGPPKI